MKLLCLFILTIAVATGAVYTDLSLTFAEDLYKEWTDLLVQQFEISDDKSSASDVVNFPKVNSGPATFIGQTNDKAHSFHSIPYAEPPIGNLRFYILCKFAYNLFVSI